jgi:hypothetical protein
MIDASTLNLNQKSFDSKEAFNQQRSLNRLFPCGVSKDGIPKYPLLDLSMVVFLHP